MIKIAEDLPRPQQRVRGVGLISGGLDSILAARIMKELGVEVHGLYFAMPWGCCDKDKALSATQKLDIPFVSLQLNEEYLEMVRKPKHGYGTALNPCVDCRAHMFTRARKYMESINAQFVFTGEVLGQRPMSQMRHSMKTIEIESGLEGRLLRPLCAQLLDPTIPEKEGLINRNRLLTISGRSRKEQLELAQKFEIDNYLPTGGGCLLTDKNFARRMEDTLEHGYRTFRETIIVKWGRHFRIAGNFKAVLGRDESENESLRRHVHPDDFILEMPDKKGPTLILKGYDPSYDIMATAAGIIQRYSKYHGSTPVEVECWPVHRAGEIKRKIG